jgi:hypothetical protein
MHKLNRLAVKFNDRHGVLVFPSTSGSVFLLREHTYM